MICLGTCCSDLRGRPEHLNRDPAHFMEVEGDVNNGTGWPLQPWVIPSVPRELPWLPTFLYTVSLICCTESSLVRNDLYAGSFGKPVEA